jgi:hypothetical protein
LSESTPANAKDSMSPTNTAAKRCRLAIGSIKSLLKRRESSLEERI